MGRICAICGKTSDRLFRFPKNESRCAKWAKFSQFNLKYVKKDTSLCIRHFSSDCIENSVPIRLKNIAVPTLVPGVVQPHTFKFRRTCFLCQSNDPTLAYFAFPKDPVQRNAWLNYCGIHLSDPNDEIQIDCVKFLCEVHFSEDDIIRRRAIRGSNRLRKNAVPNMRFITVDPDAATSSQNFHNPESQIVERECLTIVRKTGFDNSPTDPLQSEFEYHEIKQEVVSPSSSTDHIRSEAEDIQIEPKIPLDCQILTILQNNDNTITEVDRLSKVTSKPLDANISSVMNEENISALIDIFKSNFRDKCGTCKQFINHMVTHATNTNPNNTTSFIDKPSIKNEDQNHVSQNDTPTVSASTPSSHSTRKRLAYIGDIDISDLETPIRAQQSFQLAKNEILKLRKKVDIISKKLKRRDEKLNTYKNLIKRFRNEKATVV